MGLMRKLVAKTHDHVFGVVAEHALGIGDLGRHELRECIDMLVLGLLRRTRMDAGC